MEPYIPEGIYSELRTAMETRWQIVKQLNRIRNRVKRWISIYFPEFNQVFADWEGKAALIVLQDFPTPVRILEKGVEGMGRWKQDKLRGIGRKRAMCLIEAQDNLWVYGKALWLQKMTCSTCWKTINCKCSIMKEP